MLKCNRGACRLTSIKGLVKRLCFQQIGTTYCILHSGNCPDNFKSVYDLHRAHSHFSLTLPHNTNLHCMSQLGALTDATHNPKSKPKGYQPEVRPHAQT